MLISPRAAKVLKMSGIEPAKDFPATLSEKGLSPHDLAERLFELSLSSEDNIRLKVVELALKLHGLLREDQKQAPTIQILIKNDDNNVVNILTPREI